MAVAAKSKGPASDSIMPPDKMKPLLALSKQEPVNAAIGLTQDGEGLILLHKKAKPKKVLSMLKAEAQKAKLQLNNASMRFGRAEVDTDYDSGMVRFFINKDAPGNMRVKLVEVVKRIPYQKVEINVDPSLEEEPEEDTEGEEASGGPTAEIPVAPPPAPPPQPTAGGDEAALRLLLGALAKRIPEAAGTDAGRRAALLKVANIANDQIKGAQLQAAAATLEKLRQVLDASHPTGTTAPSQGGGQAMAGWTAARGAAVATLTSLEAAIRAFRDPRSDEAVILVRAIRANLTAEPGTPEQVEELERYLQTDDIIADAEAPNGFGIAVQLKAPLLAALAALRAERSAVA